MKILSLRLKNINSFRENIHIDFTAEPLCSTSLFAITGPTGSGKTTLLDAVSVALYNKTPRLDGKSNKSPANLLSQGADEGFAEVVFQVNGIPYMAEWKARRKRNGNIQIEVKLARADTGELITSKLTGKEQQDLRDMPVEKAVTKILGMDFGSFRRSILLAQGEFASFLKADAEKKRAILETTTGLDLYISLKEKLNQQVRKVSGEYEISRAALEGIPMATPEEIEAVRKELACIGEELQHLDGQRAALEKEKEAEQRRVDAYRKLEELRERQKELASGKDKMEQREHELDRARKASGIRSEMDAYDSDLLQLKNLQAELETARQEMEKSRLDFEEAKVRHNSSIQIFEKARIGGEEKKRLFNEAATLEARGLGILQEGEKKRTESIALNEKIGELKVSIQKKKDEIASIETNVHNDRKFLEQHTLPDNVEGMLSMASESAARLAEKEKTVQQRIKDLQGTEAEMQTVKEYIEKGSNAGNDLKTRKNELKAEHYRIIGKLDQQHGDENLWSSIRSAWGTVTGSTFLESYDRLLLIFEGITLQEPHIEFIGMLRSYKEKIDQLDLKVIAGQEKVQHCEEEEQLIRAKNQAIVLRQDHLAEGSPCPVCGSKDHPWAGKREPDSEELIEKAQNDLKMARSELEASETARNAALKEITGLAQEKVRTCDEKIQKILSLVKEQDRMDNDLKLLDEQIRSNDLQILSHNLQKEKLMHKIDELSDNIRSLNDEIAKEKKHFLTLIPAEFGQEAPRSAIDKFRDLIQSIKRCDQRLKEYDRIITGHETFIRENTKRIDEEHTRYTRLLAEAEHFREEAETMLARVMEMTENLGVETARSALDARIRELEVERDRHRDACEQARTRLTKIRAASDRLGSEVEQASNRCSRSRSRYMQAMASVDFASIEEHKAAIRDPDWQDATEQAVEQYQKEVHTLEENIKAQEGIFTHKPFDPGELLDILQREEQSDISIKEKNSLMGEKKERLGTLLKNLEKRQEQEKILELAGRERDRWMKLDGIMPANSLRDYALSTMFNLLIRFANKQLSDITSRYHLDFRDMKEMVVIDRWNAGEERPVETLSGGESFLVSLSLALALSELSSGRSRLESLFLDEGFGTLDGETLDAVLNAMESLRLSGRTIGLISHIEQLTGRIPVRIEVKKLGNGISRVNIRG